MKKWLQKTALDNAATAFLPGVICHPTEADAQPSFLPQVLLQKEACVDLQHRESPGLLETALLPGTGNSAPVEDVAVRGSSGRKKLCRLLRSKELCFSRCPKQRTLWLPS